MKISTIGLDLAKNVFQVHGIDEAGTVVVAKQLRRSQVSAFFEELPPCLVGMEACATAHHWSRALGGLGHEVRLMPAGYVKRNKNDAADAEAICEAVPRPTMRLVGTKSCEQQSVLMLHKTRAFLGASAPCCAMPSVATWLSLGSRRDVAAWAWRSFWRSCAMAKMGASQSLRGLLWLR